MTERSGIGYDSHRFEEGRKLILGGVEVASDRGLIGHSDADALTHAVIDALLGGAGLGDVGQHFPDTEKQWQDAHSLDLLVGTLRLLEEHGWRATHVDATVICETPKLGPYRDAMRESLARTIGIDAREVNVKFTTNEGMGAIGRGEGIAAMAVANVEARER
jgi:2-C-methyl-D-erythritol 2,4-cyclodiphosphate synthase